MPPPCPPPSFPCHGGKIMLYNVAFTMHHPHWAPTLLRLATSTSPLLLLPIEQCLKSTFLFPSISTCSFSMSGLGFLSPNCKRTKVIHSLLSQLVHPSIHSFIHHAKNEQTQSHENQNIHTYIHTYIHSFILENENQKKKSCKPKLIHSFTHSFIHYVANQNCSFFMVKFYQSRTLLKIFTSFIHSFFMVDWRKGLNKPTNM